MKIQVKVPGEDVVLVDTEYATCAIFAGLTATECAAQLESAAVGTPGKDGWVKATIGGERCLVRRASVAERRATDKTK